MNDGYGAPQAPVQTNQDGYGAPQGPVQSNQDSYGSPSGPVQSSNQYSATPVQQNQDSYGSPSGPVQARHSMFLLNFCALKHTSHECIPSYNKQSENHLVNT